MSEHVVECVICGEQAKPFGVYDDYTHQKCPRCGEFKISGTLETILQKGNYQKDHEYIVKLSGWVRKCNMLGEVAHCSDICLNALFLHVAT